MQSIVGHCNQTVLQFVTYGPMTKRKQKRNRQKEGNGEIERLRNREERPGRPRRRKKKVTSAHCDYVICCGRSAAISEWRITRDLTNLHFPFNSLSAKWQVDVINLPKSIIPRLRFFWESPNISHRLRNDLNSIEQLRIYLYIGD